MIPLGARLASAIERIEHSDQPSQTFEYSAGCTPALVDALFPSPIDAILDDPRTL
ncbi:hypothetical protein [Pendulispora albinea]|uniref:Uncharacterized protein n=1 Tax=Pendulispora albinea TaxID=2741071 RepID=A0ABZ2M7I2_9BACT